MESIELVAILVGILVIGAVSKRIRGTIITLPMLYTLFGLFVGWLFAGQLELSFDDPVVQIIAKLTLVMVLATDASRIRLGDLRRYHTLPLRLLGIGLPLTMALGAVLAAAMFGELGFWGAAVLAVILAPTDASLGQSVVSNPRVPVRIRQALNIESGLNDGIAMPFLLLALSLAVASDKGLGHGAFLGYTAAQIGFGILAGLVLGYLGARYIRWGRKSGWMSSKFQKLGWLALVLLSFGMAELIGGNGFIAAFIFGITSGNTLRHGEGESLYAYAEVENSLMILLTFVIFGMVMLAPALKHINLTVVLYALLSLTAVRMVPVAISLLGARLKPVTVLFLGWFGPRGIASILYVLTVLEEDLLTGKQTIGVVVVTTVFFSIIAHGISAAPLSNWYGNRMAAIDGQEPDVAESAHVPEMPLRTGHTPAGSGSSGVVGSNPG